MNKPLTHPKDRPAEGSSYIEGYGYVATDALRAIEALIAAQPPQAAPKAVAVECSKTFGCQCPKHFRAAPAERGVPLTDEQAHAIAAHYDMPSRVVRDIYNRANGITGGTEGGASA